MKSLYISRVKIKNYRNFEKIDVKLNHKQVIIGENNIGKTNFIRALQLILDPSFSDEDRYLDESDFFDGLENPMENKKEIEINIYFDNYSKNKTILAQLSDATIRENREEKLLITYKFFPIEKDNGKIEYQYIIFKGNNESKKFTYEDRQFINIKVIKALRDVERDMRNTRTSPINKLLKNYSIDNSDLKFIANKLEENSSDILKLDEIVDLKNNIDKKFSDILGTENNFNISLKTMDIDPNKILKSLKILLSNRTTNEISLGLNNVLYISLILLSLKDTTIPTYLKASIFDELKKNENSDILSDSYIKNKTENYFIKNNLDTSTIKKLYEFMDENNPQCDGITILAIEEPEAHLHPIYQRLIYKDVIKNNNNSVLLTTHSTHITSISPIESIVHLHTKNHKSTDIKSTTNLGLSQNELLDIERYVDIKRGEIYLGKGVILVEGIAEEYLIPRFAQLLGKPLDEKGIIVCNINSTNFKPYIQLLKNLEIPYTIITDGDFYYESISSENDIKRKYHNISYENNPCNFGYLGLEIMKRIIIELQIEKIENIPTDFNDQYESFNKLGFYIGFYTLEVDIMETCSKDPEAKKIICDIFNELTNGGMQQKINFKNELDNGEYWKCLRKIESNGIGKGRFSQKMSIKCNKKHIPKYIENAINYIYKKIDEL